LKEGLKGLTGFERDNKKMDALKPMRFLNKFYRGLAKKDLAYYGKTVTLKDADKVLMRWKVSDTESSSAICTPRRSPLKNWLSSKRPCRSSRSGLRP
jgi:hypothetical protein